MQTQPQLAKGIDVSRYSGNVDWAAVKAQGHSYAFVKATEGETLKDPAFAAHWPRLKEVGLIRGAYHFYVTRDDPAAQARFFLDTVSLEPGDLMPVVDIETLAKGTAGPPAPHLQQWLDIVEARYKAKPIIYTSHGFWNQYFQGGFGAYPLWIAEYGVSAPRIPQGWTEWHLWQWQQNAAVAGVQSGADLNHANHTGPDLSKLFIPG